MHPEDRPKVVRETSMHPTGSFLRTKLRQQVLTRTVGRAVEAHELHTQLRKHGGGLRGGFADEEVDPSYPALHRKGLPHRQSISESHGALRAPGRRFSRHQVEGWAGQGKKPSVESVRRANHDAPPVVHDIDEPSADLCAFAPHLRVQGLRFGHLLRPDDDVMRWDSTSELHRRYPNVVLRCFPYLRSTRRV
eukprot:scaffold388_cov244-Pinguiococcus_pyrenoidosus.AAC.11